MSEAANDLDRVCAWCKKDMGKKPSPETGTTHGICQDCLDDVVKKEGLPNEMTMTRAERAEAARSDYGSARNEDAKMDPEDDQFYKVMKHWEKIGDDHHYQEARAIVERRKEMGKYTRDPFK